MGLLDNFFAKPGEDDKYAMNMGLSQGLASGNVPGALMQAQQGIQDRKLSDLKMEELKALVDQHKQANAKSAQLSQALPSLFRQPGMTGGAAVPQEMGGVPMFSKPMGAAPMQSSPGGFDVRRAALMGMDPELIAKYAGLDNIGRPEVARTIETIRNGRPTTVQFDKYGQPIGQGEEQWKAPLMQNLGNRTAAIDPVSLSERGSFAQGQSPDSAASNAITMRGQNMTDARVREANNLGKVPSGYRAKPDGSLEFIPGGPADPNAAKKAAPTEWQGKSAMFGSRAQEADKIIGGLDGKYSPGAINAKAGLGKTPLIGGAMEAGGNWLLSDSGQKAEQAQRDFINAVLRLESGAAISPAEFDNARKQYFPQPFDSEAVKLQKSQNRKLAVQGLLSNARPGGAEAVTNSGGATSGWGIKEVK